MSHKPQRSAGRRFSPSLDVFQGFRKTSFTAQAKSGRTYRASTEHRPTSPGARPANREGGT
ncbi:hypothetical protein ABGB07_39865 [Micromonosporaceae bacterium B7E4]